MENQVFLSFVFYSTLLVMKMYILAIITGQIRLRKKAFANPEDAMRHGGLEFYREDPDVERYRREDFPCMGMSTDVAVQEATIEQDSNPYLTAHRNDMENIFPFLFLGAIYSLLEPNPSIARIHFLVFFLGRLVHTAAYVLALKAPTRSMAYSIAQLPCFSMAFQILFSVASYW